MLKDLTLEVFDSVEKTLELAKARGEELELIEVALPSGATVGIPIQLG